MYVVCAVVLSALSVCAGFAMSLCMQFCLYVVLHL